MKKFILLLAALTSNMAFGPKWGYAATAGEMFTAVGQTIQSRFVLLSEAQQGLFFNLNGGGQYSITKGPIFNLDKDGILTFDIGGLKDLNSQNANVTLGTTLKGNKAIGKYAPQVGELIYNYTPNISHPFMDHLWIGADVTYIADGEKGLWLYGPSVGLFWMF